MKLVKISGDARRVVLQFDRALDPKEGRNPGNYRIGGAPPLRVRVAGGFVFLTIPEMAQPNVTVTLSGSLRDTEGNAVEEGGRTLTHCPQYRRREIRVSAVQPLRITEVTDDFEEYLEYVLEWVDQAGALGSDIVCIPEDIQYQSGQSAREQSDTIPGRFTDRFAEKARKYGMYIIVQVDEKTETALFNVAVLLDRDGGIVGRYQKMFVTEGASVVPGPAMPVFETDFGVIGIMICFDIICPDVVGLLALKGAEIVFHPHAIGGTPSTEETMLILQRARAIDNGVYFVPCGFGRKIDRWGGNYGRSCIIDKNGILVADAGYKDGLASTVIDLEDVRLVSGYGGAGVSDARQRLVREMRPDLYEQMAEEARRRAGETWFEERGLWRREEE